MTQQTWRTAWAPGRVNLIGEHTDYQDGWCLPIAIGRGTTVKFRPSQDAISVITSDRFHEVVRVNTDTVSRAQIRGADSAAAYETGWGSSVVSLIAALRERGHEIAAIEAHVHSDVPLGSGLSSSASFMVALAMAFTDAADSPTSQLHGVELAHTAQRGEHINGVPCGIMDQMASVFGQEHNAVLIDCRSATTQLIPVPDSLGVVVIHSGLPRTLADSQYAQRRIACAAACERLGISALRDANLDEVADDPFARHVVTENRRVLTFVAALRANDPSALGSILNESHRSLADDFMVSTPELDTLCSLLNDAGAYGARLTGAGFGGCVVALADIAEAQVIADEAARRYQQLTKLQPLHFITAAAAGARFLANRE